MFTVQPVTKQYGATDCCLLVTREFYCDGEKKIMTAKIVPFRVAFSSSEDDDRPAEELLQPGPCSRGWASSAYSIYPQVMSIF